MMFDGSWMMGAGWLWGTLMVVGMTLLVILVVRLVATSGRQNATTNAGNPADSARRILDERYARGELSTQEYEERLTVLGKNSP